MKDEYEMLTQVQHILKRPDSYIGSIKKVTNDCWIYSDEEEKMVYGPLTYNQGLQQIFDEILVNACDHSVKDKTVKNIKVNIDIDTGVISVWNDGKGITIEKNSKHDIYNPEMIFGNLLTSSNYDDNVKRVVGGRNGYGAKVTNIYSEFFTVETVDSNKGLKYKQTWKNNMSEMGKPIIVSCKGKSYTCITFKPDYVRFGYKDGKLTMDNYKLMEKRTIDMTACTRKDVTVYFNNDKFTEKNFERYVDLYIGKRGDTKRIYMCDEDEDMIWELAVCMNDDYDSFMQVSFVNGICTENGGKHVDYVVNQIVNKLIDHIKDKSKGAAKEAASKIRYSYVKDRIWVFLRSTVVNPAFSSQTKNELTTTSSNFGFKFNVTDDFISKLAKTGITEEVMTITQFKEEKKNAKTTDGRKKNVIRGIPKLDDANFAGGAKSAECTLILTEGESAKSFAVSGLTVIGRDRYGVFPLKGKPLNVREASITQIVNNQEIIAIKQILGLQEKKKYTSPSQLRYGSILILADSDHDGYHIKALVINMIHSKWPELLKFPNFIMSLATPIKKVRLGKDTKEFFTETEYNRWIETLTESQVRNCKIKHYKGLGTSTAAEAKKCFKDLQKKQITYVTQGKKTDKAIELAFDKKKAGDRKEWIKKYNEDDIIENDEKKVNIEDLINRELIHFSVYDVKRSIPSIMDGLKPSQRKILYGCFKRKLKKQIKVAQLSGYISEHAAYHHGEVSLQGAIVAMAQDFVGSNNINLLKPCGQFGTRISGGKDYASPRYIFTKLEVLTSMIYDTRDFDLLEYLDDDGMIVEPKYYVPIIPMILVNGSEGIGTGYSTYVPSFNPTEIVKYIYKKLKSKENEVNSKVYVEFKPWYKGFKGEVERVDEKTKVAKSYITRGIVERDGDLKLRIKELPIGTWITPYKEFLESLTDEGIKVLLKDKNKKTTKKEGDGILNTFYEKHKDENIDFVLVFKDKKYLDKIMKKGEVYNVLKLEKKINLTNMHLFNSNGIIQLYKSPQEIIDEFYKVRLDLYNKRYEYLLDSLNEQSNKINSKVRFIREFISGEIKVVKQKKNVIIKQLEEREYHKFEGGYMYLIKMPIYNLTEEKIEELERIKDKIMEELEELKGKTFKDLWMDDLKNFFDKYQDWVSGVKISNDDEDNEDSDDSDNEDNEDE